MVNISLAAVALAASIGFYVVLDDAIQNQPKPKPVDVWQCDGWVGVKYVNEREMRRALR